MRAVKLAYWKADLQIMTLTHLLIPFCFNLFLFIFGLLDRGSGLPNVFCRGFVFPCCFLNFGIELSETSFISRNLGVDICNFVVKGVPRLFSY